MTKRFCNICEKELLFHQIKNHYSTNVHIDGKTISVTLSATVISISEFVPTNWQDNALCASCFLQIIQKASKLKNINKYGDDKTLN